MALPPRIPLFPLPRLVFPEEKVFLHIFEDAYKLLLQECLAEEKWFGIVLLQEDEISEIGCAVAVERVLKQYENGESDIMVTGIYRFRIQNVTEERPFFMADIVPFHEPLRTPNHKLKERLISQHLKYLEYRQEPLRLSIYEQVRYVSFTVAANLPLDVAEKQALLQIPEENNRLKHLTEYLEKLLPKVEKQKALEKLAQGDGHPSDLPYMGEK